jgi:hypothetical protein
MPKYLVTSPDGRTYQINAPEGATREQALEYAKKSSIGADKPLLPTESKFIGDEQPSPTDGMSITDLLSAGAGKAIVDTARGAGQLVGAVDRADIAESRKYDTPLMDTTAGKVGNFGGNVAIFAPTALIPGANTTTGAATIGGVAGLTQPSTSTQETISNIGFGIGGGVAGKKIGDLISDVVTARQAAKASQLPIQQAKTEAVKKAQNLGYSVPPADADAGTGSKILNAFSGKIKTEQKASSINQPITNKLIAKDLGLDPDQPITRESIAEVRKQAGQAYETIRGAGLVKADNEFKLKLDHLAKANGKMEKDFPELANGELSNLIKAVQKEEFDADSAVDAIRVLRDKADGFYAKGDKQLGKAAKQIADEMEALLGRHLKTSGAPPETLQEFQNARKLIAKTYTAEKTLNASTGNISGQKLSRELAKGRPLEGGMRDAAEFAQSFPKSAQEINATNPYSVVDAFVGLGGVVSNPAITAGVATRPVARSIILNPNYQRAFVKPKAPGNTLEYLLRGAENQAVPLSTLQALQLSSNINQ